MTSLKSSVSAGETTIALQDVKYITAGWSITLTYGTFAETREVVSVQTGTAIGDRVLGSVVLSSPLTYSYPSGTAIASASPDSPSFSGNETTSGSVGNDPVVWFGKESKMFWLPVGKLTPVIQTRHLTVLASTFVGSPREQWIDHIVVTNADGFKFADVRIKKDIASFNRSKIPQNGFETIDLKLGMDPNPMKVMPEVPSKPGIKGLFQRLDVWMVAEPLTKVFNWLPWHVDQTHIGRARREAVVVTSPDARFLIISSPATEYSGDFSYLSMEYAHLDIHILDMEHKKSVRGLLPELWGIQKMTNRTMEFCKPPWEKDAPETGRHSVDVDKEWNKNFFQV